MDRACRFVLLAFSMACPLACSEPSEEAVVQVYGQLVDVGGKPIPGADLVVRLEGEKRLDQLVSLTDSLGEFRVAVSLDHSPLWYDRLVVAYYERPCRRWNRYEAIHEFGNEPPEPFEKLVVRLIVPDKPAGRLAVGEMCGYARQASTDFDLGIAIDQLAADSAFGRFIINYSLSTRSDVGVFRGAVADDELELELTPNGAGSCPGIFQVVVRFEPNGTAARITPPVPCVIQGDSMRLVSEPFSLFF